LRGDGLIRLAQMRGDEPFLLLGGSLRGGGLIRLAQMRGDEPFLLLGGSLRGGGGAGAGAGALVAGEVCGTSRTEIQFRRSRETSSLPSRVPFWSIVVRTFGAKGPTGLPDFLRR